VWDPLAPKDPLQRTERNVINVIVGNQSRHELRSVFKALARAA